MFPIKPSDFLITTGLNKVLFTPTTLESNSKLFIFSELMLYLILIPEL